MDSRQLPDLSDWRFVEVWTLEEAAMLWAAVDPLDHENTRINELGHSVPLTQRKKALIFQRALAEAVCAGTLAFIDALELHEDDRGNTWETAVAHPKLPSPNKLMHHKTRVNQAAFMRWVGIKKIPSYRQLISISITGMENSSGHQASDVINQPTTVLLPTPAFLNPSHPRSPKELRVSFEVWEEISGDDYVKGVSLNPKRMAMLALDQHETGKNLSAAAKERISTLVNWDDKGGCPKTPGG